MLIILRAGIYTTVQDLGREDSAAWHQHRRGAGSTGAEDRQPAGGQCAGGRRAGDHPRPVQRRVYPPGWIALTGAGCDAQLDGKPLWTGWRYPVKKGQRLALGTPKRGMRSYRRSRAASPCRKCWARAAPT